MSKERSPNRLIKLEVYKSFVSAEMVKTYGITWDDAAGDLEPLESAMDARQTPKEFVTWWGEKYDLDEVS